MRYERLLSWYDRYANSYLSEADDYVYKYMNLKYNHIKKVTAISEEIAKDLKLEDEDIEIAKVIGLMHDIGRFEQIKVYRSDNDRTTINHAKESGRVIKKLNILSEYDDYTQDLILKAVLYHNMAEIPVEEEDERVIFFSKLIRDADKTDIYRVVFEDIFSMTDDELVNLYSHLSFENRVSDYVYETFKDNQMLDKSRLETFLDHTVLQLLWAKDLLYFNMTNKIIKRQGYLKKIYEHFDYNQRLEEIYNDIIKTLDYKIENKIN